MLWPVGIGQAQEKAKAQRTVVVVRADEIVVGRGYYCTWQRPWPPSDGGRSGRNYSRWAVPMGSLHMRLPS